MKVNLSKLVKGIVVVVISVVCINMLLFLQWPQGRAAILDDGFRFKKVERQGLLNKDKTPTPAPPLRLNSSTTCPGHSMLEPRPTGLFQVVADSRLHVYSAYRESRSIRIIALRQTFSALTNLRCHIWFLVSGGCDPLQITPATVENMPEDHGRRYSSAFIHCPLPELAKNETPIAVSVAPGDNCTRPTNILYLPRPGRARSQFTVCVTPLNYKYSRAYELVEMVEMNKLLGAQKIVFYNHSTGPNVDRVLEMYSLKDEVEVHQWHLPLKTDTWPPTGEPEIHYFAQLAALNDCLYRHKARSQYLVFQDLDEFIIPYHHPNWGQLIQSREALPGVKSGFQFKCIFFRKEWPRALLELQDSAKKYKSIILSYTLRESNYLPFGSRSKYIVNANLTSVVGVHEVWDSLGQIDTVPEDVAGLHHYRTWEKPDDPQPQVVDERAAKMFGHRLSLELARVWARLINVPRDINISVYGDHV